MTWEELVGIVGYPGADASVKTGQVDRELDLGLDAVALAGEQERKSIDTDWEGRGMLRSGPRNVAQVEQRGREAQRVAQLEAAAADDLANINLDVQRQLQLAQMQDEYQQGINQLEDAQLARALGYANQDAAEMMADIYASQQGTGFDPFSMFYDYFDQLDAPSMSDEKGAKKDQNQKQRSAPVLNLDKFTSGSFLGYGD